MCPPTHQNAGRGAVYPAPGAACGLQQRLQQHARFLWHHSSAARPPVGCIHDALAASTVSSAARYCPSIPRASLPPLPNSPNHWSSRISLAFNALAAEGGSNWTSRSQDAAWHSTSHCTPPHPSTQPNRNAPARKIAAMDSI
ncbi:uncharacterized protein K452DRAFT_61002 [Aplosporella prunicola CBS 121167]|uniref:Uncharacterized protein n=1 Tax=Aplosporella prunicola CBS 121167 TaxID=1176127 RepID=A0A6A6AU78_9PEZI|nr:uncharacterized protein K452DRAFT_61002 [Aplosporella prunicola CBS 121167]KAF2135146.1 hypothetical protein K452DRAFT_61002 [Aplosporella prunicola CBS 121167]